MPQDSIPHGELFCELYKRKKMEYTVGNLVYKGV